MLSYLYYSLVAYRLYESANLINYGVWGLQHTYYAYRWIIDKKKEDCTENDEDWVLIDGEDNLLVK